MIATPVAGLSSKLDGMTSEFQYLRESVGDVTSRMGKLEQQIMDLSLASKTMTAPPGPPSDGDTSSAAPPPGLTPKALYDSAYRDKIGGSLDLALSEFNDYLRYFGSTEMAPNAQYYIGEIQYNRGNWEDALAAFDAVLEKYPSNNKTPDSFFMKGMTLVKMGQRTRGADEFYELLRRFPRNELAPKARAQLRSLGLSQNPPARRSD
jgi:TolA-binding protein